MEERLFHRSVVVRNVASTATDVLEERRNSVPITSRDAGDDILRRRILRERTVAEVADAERRRVAREGEV